MATARQSTQILNINLGNHVLRAGAVAILGAVALMGLAALFGARGPVLWIIAGHQLVANTVILGWMSYVAEDEAEDEAE